MILCLLEARRSAVRRPSLFVSSTCYDLKQLRTDMKQFIEGLGLDPVLSEHANFPVNPDVGTVDNCLEVVEAKADIFVLIVGGRYGSSADTDRSVTNLEFLKARAKGVPIYVFITRSILDILPVWLQNQTGDFSSVSDSPKLFQFVADIRNTGENWVFPFDTAQDIFDTLRSQLAYLFMDALELRTRMRLSGGLSPCLRDLRGSLLRLVVERPKGWEYLLFSSALDEALTDLADLRRDWRYGVATGESVAMTINQFVHWMPTKTSEVLRMMANMNIIIKSALPVGFGPPGVSGDPEGILYAADRLAGIYRRALEWKPEFLCLVLPAELEQLRSIVSRFCDNIVPEFEEFSRKLSGSLATAISDMRLGKQGTASLTLTVTMPDHCDLQPEFDRITRLIKAGVVDPDKRP
jgi:hypothetical protein